MKKISLLVGLVSFSLSLDNSAQAAFTSIYSFGDSLSDTGNLFALTGGLAPGKDPYYFKGRFSNGPIWLDDLSAALGVPLIDYAVGGATTGTTNIGSTLLPGLQQEIAQFASTNTKADPNALYTVWAGANDYLFTALDPNNPTQAPLNNIATAVKTLTNLGAKNIMVVDLPDLGKLPIIPALPLGSSTYTALTIGNNAGLLPAIYSLGVPSDVKIIPLDVFGVANNILQNPSLYGLTNTTNSCLDKTTTPFTICANPSEYFFWDEVHPTTNINTVIAQAAANAVPEPLTILGAVTALGLAGGLKRRLGS